MRFSKWTYTGSADINYKNITDQRGREQNDQGKCCRRDYQYLRSFYFKKGFLPECWSDKLLVAMGILEQDEEVHGPDLGDLLGLAQQP